MQSRFSHCYCHCNSWPDYKIVLNNYCLCCHDNSLCKDFLLSDRSFRNHKDFLLFAVLIGSSCRCKDFLLSALDYNNPSIVFQNFQNCMGILWLSIYCNRNFVVGHSYCKDYRVLRIVVDSKDMEVLWCNHWCRNLEDMLDYFDSFLPLHRRTCHKKRNITVHHYALILCCTYK